MQQMVGAHQAPFEDFRTSDLGQAAFLLAKDTPLLRVEHEGPRAFFIFPETAKSIAELFYFPGKNLVDARRFHLSLRELRGLSRGERR